MDDRYRVDTMVITQIFILPNIKNSKSHKLYFYAILNPFYISIVITHFK